MGSDAWGLNTVRLRYFPHFVPMYLWKRQRRRVTAAQGQAQGQVSHLAKPAALV